MTVEKIDGDVRAIECHKYRNQWRNGIAKAMEGSERSITRDGGC